MTVVSAGQNMEKISAVLAVAPGTAGVNLLVRLVFRTAPSRIRSTFPFSRSLKTRQEPSNWRPGGMYTLKPDGLSPKIASPKGQ